ncbi:purine nucleoside phosphorylase [Johnsonella ignava ATCC 51276]|uniref:Purine nucleoside phosphorylase DeoD-type n=1 Tax=Johnsonella ignava ATCC 51276 TaxID=679200 RepID=G5GGT2_9FIRM|nr:purine-nucleoside phosphorylase [Johnsonella ignava]EHI55990.1 purine nucleoside phosphorylase [Johnsonella ignava ATCC 51276]
MSNIPTPHIDAKEGEIAQTILLPGDPLRARFIADNFLDNVRQFNSTRNMLGFTGTYKDREISVMGTGMGCPSIGIYSYELINFYKVKNLIRIGTAGSLMSDVHIKDVVFGMGACTTSNYPNLMGLKGTFAPICSYFLLEKAVAAAKKLGINYHVGNILSSDMFYGPYKEISGGMDWSDMGVMAVEMEAAALYTNAAAGGANALSILTISDSIITGESTSSYERQTAFTSMMEVALSLA